MKRFPPKRNFQSLSVRDLLDARDAYHVHLTHLANVVGTAVGLYRIRRADPDAEEPIDAGSLLKGSRREVAGSEEPRTLGNTVVRKWSWPCILVFVDKWRTPDSFRSEPDDWVPRFLYLPDGRVIPTCVILAEMDKSAGAPIQKLSFPSGLIGGGYPLLTENQEQERVGSLGCLVTNGDLVFALTNRHAVGEPGQEVYSFVRGERKVIGRSDARQIGKLSFPEVYRGWPGTRSELNLDVGLVRVSDVSDWTAQVFGVGELGPVIDLNTDTISLDLIGCPMRAFGAASGELRGEIQGLFYRYRSMGGFDFVADLLIGPRERDVLSTRPGDSGTVWVWDVEKSGESEDTDRGQRAPQLRPMALQWGGHAFLDGTSRERMQFALATNLSTVLRLLDVDLIRDWNIGHSEYWGKVGHYKVGGSACLLASDPALDELLRANLDRIAFGDEPISDGTVTAYNPEGFAALADVADLVWRDTRKKDAANHFADMDQEGEGDFAGTTLRALYDANPRTLDPALWNRFYESLGMKLQHRGSLPFRVWEIYDQLVEFVREGEIEKFVCAAGCLAHYLGDACQPLHVSFLHHGLPDDSSDDKVHSDYETKMLDRHAAKVVEGVNLRLDGRSVDPDWLFQGGYEAARAVVNLMLRTLDHLPPQEILEAFQGPGTGRIKRMWEALSDRTMDVLAEGSLTLATIWQSAWVEGIAAREDAGLPAIDPGELRAVSRTTLRNLYEDRDFIPSSWLPDMAANLQVPQE